MNPLRRTNRYLLWTAALIWTAVIFLTLPYAPVWRDWITEHLSEHLILIVIVAILASILIFSIFRNIRRKAPFQDYVILGFITAGYIYSLHRIVIIVEQVHFVEYGLLAYLIISALRADWKDQGQYLNALLLVTLVGVADEYVQGNLINRVGELRDVYLNILSGALALAWFRFCVKPEETPSNWRETLTFALPVAGLIILGIGIFNSRISEFGYYIKDPEIGEFYSRFSADKLKQESPNSVYFKTEVLPKFYKGSYNELLRSLKGSIYDEVLVHIFCRDKRLERGESYTAFRENQILEKYFPSFIDGTEHQWTVSRKAEVGKACEGSLGELYISPVSAQIITSFSEVVQWTVIGFLEVVIIVSWLVVIRRRGRID